MLLPEGPVLHSFTKHYKLYPSQCHSADIAPQNLYKVTQTVSQKQDPWQKKAMANVHIMRENCVRLKISV